MQSTKLYNSNRTEWSPTQSVIICVITESDFLNHEHDYQPNWMTKTSGNHNYDKI